MSECRQSRPISTLETAVTLLRQVLDQRPPPHPLRSETLRSLCTALLIRFNQWGWIEDCDEAVSLLTELSGASNQTSAVIPEAQVCCEVMNRRPSLTTLPGRYRCQRDDPGW
jgi:hypothetical protein